MEISVHQNAEPILTDAECVCGCALRVPVLENVNFEKYKQEQTKQKYFEYSTHVQN
jgi:hypothetical protein